MAAVAMADAERDLVPAAAEVSRLQAAFEQAQLTLRDYQFTTPIAAVVLNRSLEPGNLDQQAVRLMV